MPPSTIFLDKMIRLPNRMVRLSSLEDAADSFGSNPETSHFPFKVHAMLTYAEEHGLNDIVEWLDDHSFIVHDQNRFVRDVLPKFCRQSKYKSFQRQCNLWGFQRLNKGSNKGAYSHEFLVRGDAKACKHIVRQQQPPKKKKIKPSQTLPNPGNGFGMMNTVNPLPAMTFPSFWVSCESLDPFRHPTPFSTAMGADTMDGSRNSVLSTQSSFEGRPFFEVDEHVGDEILEEVVVPRMTHHTSRRALRRVSVLYPYEK